MPRAWTFYKNQLHWLDLPDGTPFQPTGVNSCGNIVGSVVLCLVAVWLGHVLAIGLNTVKWV